MKDTEIILDMLKEVRSDQKATNEKLNEHSIILTKLGSDVSKNTEDLEEHILGVKNAQKRLELLEKPHMVRNYIFKVLLGSGGLSGSSYGVYKLWELFFS